MENKLDQSFLVNEKIGVLMRKYAIPCILSLLVAALYNIVDQLFISNSYLGANGNAANTIVYPLTVVALALAVMIGDGCCAFVSIALGKKENGRASSAIGTSITSSIIVGVVVFIIYLIGNLNFFNSNATSFLVDLFGGSKSSNPEAYANSVEYFFYITLGIPFYVFGQALNPIIRSDGSPKFAMVSTLVGAILNIILDPLFIYVFKWGMMGAAVATILGQIVTAILAVWYLFHLKSVKLEKANFKVDFKLLGRLCLMGLCSFLSQFSLVLAMMAINNMVTKYSPDAGFTGEYASIPMATIGIVMKFFQIVISIVVGASAGCIPIVGFNIGANHPERVKKLLTYLMILLFIVGLIAFFIIMFGSTGLINLFGGNNTANSSKEFLDLYRSFGVKCFKTYLCMVILASINKGAFIFLQAMGKAVTSTILSMVREIVFGVGFAYILPLKWGLDGVLYSMPVSDVLTFILSAIVLIVTYKQLNGMMKANPKTTE